jgi:hypothetical protein
MSGEECDPEWYDELIAPSGKPICKFVKEVIWKKFSEELPPFGVNVLALEKSGRYEITWIGDYDGLMRPVAQVIYSGHPSQPSFRFLDSDHMYEYWITLPSRPNER